MPVRQETINVASNKKVEEIRTPSLGLGREFIEKFVNVPAPEGKAANYGCGGSDQFGPCNK